MENITITINAAVTTDADRKALEKRIAEQIRLLANPVREDEGLTVIHSVKIQG